MELTFDAEDFKSEPRGIVKSTLALYKACKDISSCNINFNGVLRKPLSFHKPDYIETIRIKPNMPRYIWRFLVFNALSYNNNLFHFPANGMVPCFTKKCMVATTIHDVVQITMPNFYKKEKDLLKFITRKQSDINRSNIIFTVSEFSKNEICKHFITKSEPIVIYNAPILDNRNIVPIMDINYCGDYFLSVGSYDRRKGTNELLKVFIDLYLTSNVSPKLYLTGGQSYYSDEFRNNVKKAVELGIVKELGYVTDENLVTLIQNSLGMVYLSKYEGFGMPPVEAMNIGSPVITTHFTSIPEICGDAVIYVEPDNIRDIRDAILCISNSSSKRANMINNGKKQVSKYSWGKSATIFLDAITTLNDSALT